MLQTRQDIPKLEVLQQKGFRFSCRHFSGVSAMLVF